MEGLLREDVVAEVDRFVNELLEKVGFRRPPVDAIALAQSALGMAVVVDQNQPQRGRAQRISQQKQIYLRPEPTEERHQWTVAHEIGEHLKPELLKRLGWQPGEVKPMTGESLANLFAYRLLVPTCWFRDDVGDHDHDLLELKQRYKTASHEVIAWRMLDLPDPCIITVIDNERITRRRSNAWQTRRKLEPAEEQCFRQVHARGKPRQVRQEGWTVQGWPVHEIEWKREILRSVVEQEF